MASQRTVVAAAVVAAGAYAFLNYHHLLSVRTEKDAFTGAVEYLRELKWFLDKGQITQAQYDQFRDNLTPYMADRYKSFTWYNFPDLQELYERYYQDGAVDKAELAAQIVTRTAEILNSNTPIMGMEGRFEPVCDIWTQIW